MEGKTARGASSPAKPALHMPDPLSTTRADASSSHILALRLSLGLYGGSTAERNPIRITRVSCVCVSWQQMTLTTSIYHSDSNQSDSLCGRAVHLNKFCPTCRTIDLFRHSNMLMNSLSMPSTGHRKGRETRQHIIYFCPQGGSSSCTLPSPW